jgi:hypothetical protein
MRHRGIIFLLGLCMTATAVATPKKVKPALPPEQIDLPKIANPLTQIEAASAAAADHPESSVEMPGSDGDKAQADYNREYWLYRRDVLNHSRRVYAWQHTSSIIIFFVVIFLVLVGVAFSWLQFKAAAYKGESEALDASMQGVKITSSTLGVIILVLSMCFFYLYLRYVYPVNVNEDASAPATETHKGAGR